MGSIFCCCKKRQNIDYQGDINIKLVSEEENNDIKYKREVLEMCISNDRRYKYFLKTIQDFTDEQINYLFNADIDFFQSLIHEHYYEFSSLVHRIENLNFIFQEWYKNPEKHIYIKKLWLSEKTVSDILDKPSFERENIITEIFGDDMPFIDQFEFNQILELTPESRAEDIYKDIEKNNKDFYSLVEMSLQNHKDINQKYYDYLFDTDENKKKINNMYLEKSDNIIDSLLKNAVDCFKEKIPKKIRNSKIVERIAEAIRRKFRNNGNSSHEIKYQKILDLANSFKNGNAIAQLLKDIKDSLSNPIGCISTVAFSFINLYQSISSFYKYCVVYRGKKKEFADRLKIINDKFESHIKRLEFFDIKKTDNLIEAEELLVSIGAEVEQDRKEVIKLSEEIEKEIVALKKENKENAISIFRTVIGAIGCALGIVAVEGPLGIFYGAGFVANSVNTAISSAKHIQNKKDIKDFESLLEATNDQYKRIRGAIKELERQYNLIQSKYY